MTYIRSAAALALALGLSACAWRRTPVPVYSETGTVAALVGEWSGDYNSRDTGRSGLITFRLTSERDTAFGEVIMQPYDREAHTRAGDQPQVAAPAQKVSEPLKIRFVRMAGTRVTGTLDTYRDPDCGDQVVTTFEGWFVGPNQIEGTFHTRGLAMGHIPADGRWKVYRQPGKATTPED
jgi:hypothetical protein